MSHQKNDLVLRFFKPEEFQGWWDLMDQNLLQKLDSFRAIWGCPILVSPAEGGVGRRAGVHNESMHNIDRWGLVRAIDVFPKVHDGYGKYVYVQRSTDRHRLMQLALNLGFTGVGLYTDTKPGNMLHLDVRVTSTPKMWSRKDGQYQSIHEVLK